MQNIGRLRSGRRHHVAPQLYPERERRLLFVTPNEQNPQDGVNPVVPGGGIPQDSPEAAAARAAREAQERKDHSLTPFEVWKQEQGIPIDTTLRDAQHPQTLEEFSEATLSPGEAIERLRRPVKETMTYVISAENMDQLQRSPLMLRELLRGNFMDQEQRWNLEQAMWDEDKKRLEKRYPGRNRMHGLHLPDHEVMGFIQNHPENARVREWRNNMHRSLCDPQKLLTLIRGLEAKELEYVDLEQQVFDQKGVDLDRLAGKNMSYQEKNEAELSRPDTEQCANLIEEIILSDIPHDQKLQLIQTVTGVDPAKFDTPKTSRLSDDERIERIGRLALQQVAASPEGRRFAEQNKNPVLCLWNHFRDAFSTARKERVQRLDDGTEHQTPQDVLQELRKTTDELKEVLEANIHERAKKLYDRFTQRVMEAEGMSLGQVYARYGVAKNALQSMYIGALPLEGMLRRHEEHQGDTHAPRNLPPIADERFNIEASAALEQLGEFERRENSSTDLFDSLLNEAKEEASHKQEWARNIGDQLSAFFRRTDAKKVMKRVQAMLRAGPVYTNKDIRHSTKLKNDEIASLPKMLKDLQQKFEPFSDAGQQPNTPGSKPRHRPMSFSTSELAKRLHDLHEFYGRSQFLPEILGMLNKPETLDNVERGYAQQRSQETAQPSTEQIKQLETQLGEAYAPQGELRAELREHHLSASLMLREELGKQLDNAGTFIKEGRPEQLNKAEEILKQFAKAKEEFVRLRSPENIEEITDQSVFQQKTGNAGALAFYDRNDGKILLNIKAIIKKALGKKEEEIEGMQTQDLAKALKEERVQKLIEKLKYHEIEHGMVDILTNRTQLLPTLISDLEVSLEKFPPTLGNGQNFKDILLRQQEKWGVDEDERCQLYEKARQQLGKDAGSGNQLNDRYQQLLLKELTEELLVKHSCWVNEGKPDVTDEDKRILFQHVDDVLSGRSVQTTLPLAPFTTRSGRFATEHDDDGHGEGGGGNNGHGEQERTNGNGDELINVRNELSRFQQDLQGLNAFVTSYPEYGAQLNPYIKNFEELYQWVLEQSESAEAGGVYKALQQMRNGTTSEIGLDKILKLVKEERVKRMNLGDVPAQGRAGWRAIFDHITFMSVRDFTAMFSKGWEDIQRMWKRERELAQAATGEGLFGIIPKGVPYVGRLQNEYKRRQHAQELEEVEQWKNALKDRDVYLLQADFKHVRNKDQLRAMLEILTEHGHLELNDPNLWDALNDLSQYKMPHAACLEDDVLRDKWLQKLITDIWSDKEHWWKWKAANDSGIQHGKQKFTSTVDQLANTGGMKTTLQSILKRWTISHHSGGTIPVPEDVHPHFYEEIIHYAIRKGKMSMEEKFFYLIQGVRHQLLSIDRIRVLAGDGGGVLNQFPWIDYFYQKNNSFSFIENLGARLDPNDAFEPDYRTTIWFHTELLAEESVRQRLSKAQSLGAQNFDHEDIPGVVAMVDYNNINNLASAHVGTQQKVTQEGWRNAYVGFGTRFKILARMAEMEEQGLTQFTTADLNQLAVGIGAFIQMDNILTRNGIDERGQERPRLSWNDIDNTTGPSTNGVLVRRFRNANLGLVHAILDDPSIMTQRDWQSIGLTGPNDFVRSVGDKSSQDGTQNDREKQKTRFNATETFVGRLQTALKNNSELVKRILRLHADTLISERGRPGEEGRLSLNEDDQYISRSRTKEFFQQQRRSRQETGGGHAGHDHDA